MSEFNPNSPTGYKLPDPTNQNPFWDEDTPTPPSDFHGLPPGGEPGQVLTKSSYADYDADWQEPTGGGGGEGGTSDYNELTNKPSINGSQLRGDKTLEQLGIASADDMRQMNQELEGQIAAEQADRKQADDDLEAGIKANADAIQDEATAREQADSDFTITLTAHTQELLQHSNDIGDLQTDVEDINKRIDDIGPGSDGGYYTPNVSEEGELTWTASKSSMPTVPSSNVMGPRGPIGETGPEGPTGARGPAGPAGETGPEGPAGPAGAVGPTGAPGPQGETGPEGPRGPAGADGEEGGYYQPSVSNDGEITWQASKEGMPAISPANIKGPKGEDGLRGPQGLQGPKGDTGAQGPEGPAGSAGAAASVRVGTTTTLPAGSQATVTNSGTSQDAVLNFGIPKGADGSGGGGSLELSSIAGNFYVGAAPSISGSTLSIELEPAQLPDDFKNALPYVIGGFITINLIGPYLNWTGPLIPIKSWKGGRGVRFLSQGISARYGTTDYTTVSGDNSITDDSTSFINLTFQGSLGGGTTITNVQITYTLVTAGAPAATAEQEAKTLDVLKEIQTRGENVAKLLKAEERVY